MPKPATNETLSQDGVPPGGFDAPVVEQGKIVPTVPAVPFEHAPEVKEPESKVEDKVDDKPEVDFTEFLKVKEVHHIPEAPIKKEEVKKEEIEKKEDEVTPPEKPSPIREVRQQRDLSGIPEEIAPLFHKMGNETFNTLKPKFVEYEKTVAELKQKLAEKESTALPPAYYEHPESYVLQPEFKKATELHSMANTILNHWNTQLQKLEEGSEEYDDLDVDQNGQLYRVPQKANSMSKNFILQKANLAQQHIYSTRAEIDGLKRNHSARTTESVNQLTNWEKQAFPLFEKPESAALRTIVDDTIKRFPVPFQSSPTARIAAKAMVSLSEAIKIIHELQRNGSKPQVVQKQPNAADVAGDTAVENKGPTEPTFDDYKKLSYGGL